MTPTCHQARQAGDRPRVSRPHAPAWNASWVRQGPPLFDVQSVFGFPPLPAGSRDSATNACNTTRPPPASPRPLEAPPGALPDQRRQRRSRTDASSVSGSRALPGRRSVATTGASQGIQLLGSDRSSLAGFTASPRRSRLTPPPPSPRPSASPLRGRRRPLASTVDSPDACAGEGTRHLPLPRILPSSTTRQDHGVTPRDGRCGRSRIVSRWSSIPPVENVLGDLPAARHANTGVPFRRRSSSIGPIACGARLPPQLRPLRIGFDDPSDRGTPT